MRNRIRTIGTVSIKNINHDKLSMFEFSDSIHSICLDPRFDTSRAFCVGVGESKCIINRKGWFGNTSTIVHQGEGVVSTISWRENLLAWCTEKSVKIYDTEKEVRISSLDRPKSACYMNWESSKYLLVGWSDTIKIIQISQRRLSSGHSQLYAEIVRMFRTPYDIYGLAPWGKKSIAVLAMGRDDEDEEEEEEDRVELSELHIISRDSGEEMSSDLLELRGFEQYDKTDYSLHHSSDCKNLYVVASKDVVLAKPRNIIDRIRWLLKRNRFETILNILKSSASDDSSAEHDDVPTTLKSQFAESYMSALVSSKKWSRAASFCSDLVSMSCGSDSHNDEKGKLWEKWISVFAKHRNLDKIALYVPISSPQLPKYVYEMILNEYLATSNIEGLLKILRQWVVEDENRANIFDLQKVILRTRTMLKTVKIVDENTRHRAVLLSETLAMLYRAAGEHKNALQIHLSSPEPPAVPRNVFVMLETHNLLSDSLEENLGAYIDRSRQERETKLEFNMNTQGRFFVWIRRKRCV